MVVRVRLKTLPLRQWDVARELRRRIVKTFGALGIVMPVRATAVIGGQVGSPAPARDQERTVT
jgi:small conductance mechanosensitive channel